MGTFCTQRYRLSRQQAAGTETAEGEGTRDTQCFTGVHSPPSYSSLKIIPLTHLLSEEERVPSSYRGMQDNQPERQPMDMQATQGVGSGVQGRCGWLKFGP